jgi:hypothetical protein
MNNNEQEFLMIVMYKKMIEVSKEPNLDPTNYHTICNIIAMFS